MCRVLQCIAGAHNDVRVEGKGKECATTTQKIKISKRSHGSPVTIFSLYPNVYKHMNGDSTKDEKEKSQYMQYQDTICSEAEEGNGDRP